MQPYYDKDGITIYHGDCREVMPTLQGIDILITDPPYGIQASKKGAHSSIRDSQKWPNSDWDDKRVPEGVAAAISLARVSFVWGGNFYSDVLPPSASWLIWIKPEAETGFSLADCEMCWSNGGFAARVKRCPRRDGNLHPTQKPLAMMQWPLGLAGDGTVLDPFMGSGTTLRAAKDLGRRAIGIEIEERYCEIAANRLAQGVLF